MSRSERKGRTPKHGPVFTGLWIGIGIVVAPPVHAQPGAATETVATQDISVEISAAMAPRGQMRSFILRTLQTTVSGAMIVQKLGTEQAASVFGLETDKVVEKYGDQWTAALAAAYRETLTPAELSAALVAARDRDQVKLMPFLVRVGPVMQTKATPLLEKASAEALANIFARPEMK